MYSPPPSYLRILFRQIRRRRIIIYKYGSTGFNLLERFAFVTFLLTPRLALFKHSFAVDTREGYLYSRQARLGVLHLQKLKKKKKIFLSQVYFDFMDP